MGRHSWSGGHGYLQRVPMYPDIRLPEEHPPPFQENQWARLARELPPDSASGRRMAQVLTCIRRDGIEYRPGGDRDRIAVDHKGYAEFRAVEAIGTTPWESLELELGGGSKPASTPQSRAVVVYGGADRPGRDVWADWSSARNAPEAGD